MSEALQIWLKEGKFSIIAEIRNGRDIFTGNTVHL